MGGRMLYLWDSFQYGLPKTLAESRQVFTKLYEDDWQSPENLSLFETSSPTEKKYVPSHGLLAFAQRIQDIARLDKTIEGACRKPYLHLAEKALAHQQALFALELPDIPQSRFLPMLLRIIETARQFGLVVVDDDNLGMVFLPSGEILPPEKEDLWIGFLEYQEDKSTFKSLEEFKAFTQPLIEKMMTGYGYHFTTVPMSRKVSETEMTPVYLKECPIGLQFLCFGYYENNSGYSMGFTFDIKSDLVNAIYQKSKLIQIGRYSTIYFDVLHLLISLDIRKDFDDFRMNDTDSVRKLLSLIEKTIVPLFTATQDIIGLDNVLNGNFFDQRIQRSLQGNGLVTPVSLIVARLANNPHFEELAVSLATPRMPMANRDLLETEWPKLVKYLRGEVKPLV